ncbi:protein kinase [Nocardia sp. NPDC088792]|uniref:protein kinase domain-containing protein n=1 Tax=Nocardia sp. NPDC088792 TaxID=3364332 RepID=UPI003829CACE
MRETIGGGRYRLVGPIGAGGMGDVYDGYDQHLEREVAIKFPQLGPHADPGLTQRFLREARTMAKLSHPGLPTIHDAGAEPGTPETPYIVMQYIEGVTLEKLRANHGRLSIGVVACLGAQAAAALSAVHRFRIHHRDLKPANLMLCPDGTLKVLDFGLAMRYDIDLTRLTRVGGFIGTPAYMAPEQFEGSVTPQTDLYALGLVLYELLTGERALTAGTPALVYRRRMVGPPPDVRDRRPEVPADVAYLLIRMLDSDPDRRPSDAVAVQEVLLRHRTPLRELPEVTDPDGPVHGFALALVSSVPDVANDNADRRPGAAMDFSRADILRAIGHAGDLADGSDYGRVAVDLEFAVGKAVSAFGSRDADVVEARLKLADLRFEIGDYAVAMELYRGLLDDLTDRGPYDDQVMYCQRRLALCQVRLGETKLALNGLRSLHRRMAVRHGEQDWRVVELAEQIENLRAS